MEFTHYDNEIVLYGENNEVLANVTFPNVGDGVVNVNHTFVDESQRGKKIASKLMEELVKNLEKTNRKAVLTCTYAISWFEKNPEYSRFIQK